MATIFDKFLQAQVTSNRNAVGCEDLYASHRTRVTAAIVGLAPPAPGRLCLLGAGSCVDVDLAALAAVFRDIHLVDIDTGALTRAVERQPAAVRERLVAHGGLDLSGILRRLDRWKKAPPTLAQLDALVAPAVAAIGAALSGPFDAVASCCLVTQMSRALTEGLGPEHASLADARRRMTAIHLRTLVALLAPGGRALLATDLVSNETYPLDAIEAGTDLRALLETLVLEQNFFEGADPALYAQLFRRDPVLSQQTGRAVPLTPWLWQASPQRTFLVHAFTFTRQAEAAP